MPPDGTRRLSEQALRPRRAGTLILAVLVLLVLFGQPIGRLVDGSTRPDDDERGGLVIDMEQIARSAGAVGFLAGVQRGQLGHATRQEALAASDTISQGFAAPSTRSASARRNASHRGTILWVDDNPSDDLALMDAFEDVGIKVVQAASTGDALDQLERAQFDVIITDTTRRNDDQAGVKLIDALRRRGLDTPVIIYSADWTRQDQPPPQKPGVTAVTDDLSVIYKVTLREVRTARQQDSRG